MMQAMVFVLSDKMKAVNGDHVPLREGMES
jgi:hypothetical protein